MTAICGGGASRPRSVAPGAVFLAGEAVAAILQARFGLSPTWISLLGFAAGQSIDLTTFCATDPPTMPTFTNLDVVALLQQNELISPGAYDKFARLIQIGAWYTFCECSSVATPSPPAGPAYPTDAPVVNPPGLIPSPTTTPCFSRVGRSVAPGSSIVGNVDPTPIPPGPGTSAWINGTVIQHGTTRPAYWEVYPFYIASTGAQTAGAMVHLNAAGTPLVRIADPPSDTAQMYVRVAQPSPYSSADEIALQLNIYCDGQLPSGGAGGACCPPDPTVLQRLDALFNLVTIMQRQEVPFAYIHGTTHTGLTGEGHITVQGLIGALVTLTTIPGNVGLQSGDPLVYWEAGWINWGNADGSTPREFISASPQISLPRAAGQYTRIGYSLQPDVVATITELVREP